MVLRPLPVLVAAAGLVLISAVGVQFFSAAPPVATLHAPLEKLVPRDLPGWSVRDVPLADTAEGRNAVQGILRYDDFISRSYRRGPTEVTLYIAYWAPDRVPPRLVGRHTPDRCWIQNGWTCDSRTRAVVLPGTNGAPLQPAEAGVYSFSNQATLHVAFWHLVGGKAYAYGPEQSDMVALAPLTDLKTFGLNQRQEQFFIRIASNEKLEAFWTDPAFQKLLRSIESLGVAQAG